MKIIKSTGCTAFYTTIDGKNLNEFSIEEKEVLLDRLLKISNRHGIESTINILLDTIDCEYEDGGYCEQCNDSTTRQIYDLDDYESLDNTIKNSWNREEVIKIVENYISSDKLSNLGHGHLYKWCRENI